MKNRVFILSFLISMISVNFVFAQTSTKKLSYQAVVRNAANELVVNQNLSVEITILNAENAPQYRETHPSVPTNQNGLLWLWIGEGNPTLGTMANVVWKDATIRSIFTLPDGNTVTQNTPVTAMPHALFADEVDTVFLQNYLNTHDVVPDNYVTHPQLNDTLDHYYTKGNVDNILNDYEKKSELCGDVKDCIKDTLGKYTTSNQIDTLLGAYYDSTQVKSAIHDTADAIRAAIPASQVNADWNATGGPAEILNKPDLSVYATTNALKDSLTRYVDKDKLTDTLNAYHDTTHIKQTLKQYLKTGELCDSVMNCNGIKTMQTDIATNTTNIGTNAAAISSIQTKWHNDSITLTDRIHDDSLTLAHRMDTVYKHLCDSVMNCTGIQSMQTDIATNTTNIATNTTNIATNAAAISSLQTKWHNDSITLTDRIHDDSLTLAHRMDTVYKHLCDSVMNCTDIQTMQTSIETNTANIGTNAAAISSLQTKWHNDSITLTDRIHDDSLTLAHRMDTVYKHLCDSVMNCNGIKTMQTDIATNTTNIGTNAAAISSLQTKWHNDSITLTDRIHDDSLTLAHRMDTVYKHLCDSVMNCTGIQSMQTDIATNTTNIATNTTNIGTNAAAISSLQTKWHNDSITLTGKIRSDSSTVHGALVDSLKHYLDSAQVVRSIHDSIGNGTLSIKYGDNAPVTFTANQKTPSNIEIPAAEAPVYGTLTLQKNGATIDAFTANTNKTINIEVPTKLSQLSNDGGTYAKRDSVNVFTQANDFTGGTITVPSKFDIQSPPTAATCTQDAVNICDLMSVFDSLMRRMQKLEDALADAQEELEEIKSTMPALNLTASIPDEHIVSEETAVDITYTATILRSSATFTYSWYVNGVLQEGQTASTLTYHHDASGVYKVKCVATDGVNELKDDLTKTICLNGPLTMEYSFISGDSADFGKIRILGSTATSAIWYNEDKKEVGRWNSGLTDVLPVGEYAVALSSSSCERVDTVKITLIASPLCMAGHLNERYEKGVKANGIDYVTEVKDIDGNWYKVVDIAGLCWTRENMRATRYCTGTNDTVIIYVSSEDSPDQPYRYFSKGNDDSVNVYGYLYNWTAATAGAADNNDQSVYTRGVCPEGWHLPSYNNALQNLGNYSAGMLAGSWPKETWGNCSTDAAPCNRNYPERNITGFSAIQAGYYFQGFTDAGANFWLYRGVNWAGYNLQFISSTSNLSIYPNNKISGNSVRCVRDDIELDPSLSLSSDPDGGTVSICGKESVAVTYTATINNDYPEDYTYTWSVNPNEPCTVAPSGNTCTVTYTMAGAYTVSCTATKNDNTIARSATISTTVDCELVPDITYCTHDLKVTVWDTTGNPTSIQWGDETTDNSVTPYQTYHIYGTPGTYQLVVSNSDYSRTIPVTVDKPHTTCTVSNLSANEAGSGTVIDSVKDHQDNWYEVVQIGTQCWLKENMRCTTTPKGTSIVYEPTTADDHTVLISYITPRAHWYNNDRSTYEPMGYGLLYNWCAAMDTAKTGDDTPWSCTFTGHRRGICPQGWHVPTSQEWSDMETVVNDNNTITTNYGWNYFPNSGNLTTSCYWTEIERFPNNIPWPSSGAPGDYSYVHNSSGFSILPAGCFRNDPLGFFYAGPVGPEVKASNYPSTPQGMKDYTDAILTNTTFWTSDESSNLSAWTRYMVYNTAGVWNHNDGKNCGYSVRCVRD